MSICLEVEPIGGTHEDELVEDLRAFADRLGIMVHAKHNGTMMMASPGETRDVVRDRFLRMKWANENRKHEIATHVHVGGDPAKTAERVKDFVSHYGAPRVMTPGFG